MQEDALQTSHAAESICSILLGEMLTRLKKERFVLFLREEKCRKVPNMFPILCVRLRVVM